MDVYAEVTTAEKTSGDDWSLEHVRNFTYGGGEIIDQNWTAARATISNLRHVWFYKESLAQFGPLQAIFGHTYIGFTFSDGTEYGFSIEARRHENELYDPFIKGTFGAYELIYLWGTLEDFQAFRQHYQNKTLERYSITMTQKESEQFLVACFDATNKNVKKPETYNTLTNQCTNELMKVFGKALPKRLSWHPYWHITGLSSHYLARRGLLDLASKEIIS